MMSAEILNYLSWDDNDGGYSREGSKFFPKKIRCIICGASGSGKTQLVLNMILQEWVKFRKLIIVSPSLFQPMYQVLIRGLNEQLPLDVITNIFKMKEEIKGSGHKIDAVIEMLGREIGCAAGMSIESYDKSEELPDIKNLGSDALVIFDDMMLDKNAVKRAEEFFTRGRPMGISIIFISQSFYEIPRRTIRENSNFIILFKQNMKSLDQLFKDCVEPDMVKEEFVKFCKESWREKHSFLTIDKTSDPLNGKYRKGLDTFYIPEEYL